ncbi:MAG TPA: tol-pal system protein [Paracoccus sp. (in: a-proteobacteria)]|nr:tol-pal system protein [Paracoccus sp. (in: a-proteobacteria)]
MLRALILGAALALAVPAAAQQARAPDAATLADLRVQLKALTAGLQSLRAELTASGAAGFQAAGGDAALDRMNAMEAELSRLTGETERLKSRIERAVKDGTNRIGDIEFRLCEMEEGCDLGALTTPSLGDQAGGGSSDLRGDPGGIPAAAATAPLTAQEQADFAKAAEAMQAGDFAKAAELYGAFAATHAGGPKAAEALFLKGAALDSVSDPKGATAAWLQAFAADPAGPHAPDALLGLSRVSAAGRPASEGCLYLMELASRFPGTPQAAEADKRMISAGCAAGAADVGEEMDDPEAAADLADGG